MRTIHKFPLKFREDGTCHRDIPHNAIITSVGWDEKIQLFCLWGIVDTKDAITGFRTFVIKGTGHQIEDPEECMIFIGSVIQHPFVWHFFERKEMYHLFAGSVFSSYEEYERAYKDWEDSQDYD